MICIGLRQAQEGYSRKQGKSQFSKGILIKKPQSFLEFFQNFFNFGPNAQSFAGRSLTFQCPKKIIQLLWMNLHFSTKSTRCYPKIPRIFMPFSIILYISYVLSFLINFSKRFTANFCEFKGYHKNLKFSNTFRKNQKFL